MISMIKGINTKSKMFVVNIGTSIPFSKMLIQYALEQKIGFEPISSLS